MRAHLSTGWLARIRRNGLANATLLVIAAAASLAGCNGCLGFDHYRLVNGPVGGGGSGAFGGFGGSGGSSNGGGGASCVPSTEDGAVTVAYVVAAGETSAGNGCGSSGATPGIDIVSLDAMDGSCIASALVAASAGTVVGGPPSVRFDRSGNAFVAGAFRKGTLAFPSSCSGADISLDGLTGTTQAIYFAQLLRQGASFCTVWAKRAFTSDAGAGGKLHVEASAVATASSLGVTGSLGPALVHFGDPTDPTTDVAGGPFVASFSTDGTLVAVHGLASAAVGDTSLGIAPIGGQWLATGVVENARPQCHGCTVGVDAVDGPQPSCGGTGSGGAGGGGAGGAGPDAPNAMLWQPEVQSNACTFDAYGSDLAGSTPQIGFGIWADSCSTYWTGLAGTASWSISDIGLFAGDGKTHDAFLAGFGYNSGMGCGAPSQFSERLVPSIAGASAFGHRVASLACNAGPVSATVVENAAGGRVDVRRCVGAANFGDPPSCDAQPAEAALASSSDKQLLVTGFDSTGALAWSGAIAPLVVDVAAAPLPGRPQDDLTTDDRGLSYVVVTTSGPLVTEHIDAGPCDLVSVTDAGTWLFALDGAGSSGKASCVWAKRLGP